MGSTGRRTKPPARFGCRVFLSAGEPFQRIVQRAKLCERLGFDSVLLDDHLLYGTHLARAPEPFTTLAGILAETRKIGAGIAVTDFVRRHPAVIAQTLATLASEFPKRIFLGLGAGDPMNQTPFGFPTDHRYGILRDGLRIVQKLWKSNISNPQSFKGRFFTLNNAYLQADQEAVQKPPIYLAAFGPKMLRLAGELADGWIPHCHTPKTYEKDLSVVQGSANHTGREQAAFIPAYYTLSSISTDRDDANRNILGPAKYFLALNPEALKKVDPNTDHPGRIWERISHPREQRETIRKIAMDIPEQDAFNTVVHGSGDDCIEQIEDYRKAGCDEFMLTFTPRDGLWSAEDLPSQLRLFSRKVLDHYSK